MSREGPVKGCEWVDLLRRVAIFVLFARLSIMSSLVCDYRDGAAKSRHCRMINNLVKAPYSTLTACDLNKGTI